LPDERLGFAGLADNAGRKTGDTRIGAHCAVRTHCRSSSARVSPGGAVDASGRGRASHILANCASHTTRQAANSSVSADGTADAGSLCNRALVGSFGA